MDESNIYNDPIISKRRSGSIYDPYLTIKEELRISNGRVVLTEIPNRFNKVTVTSSGEVWGETQDDAQGVLYKVDYSRGIVFFDTIHNSKTLTFEYFGEGVEFLPDDRVCHIADDNDILTVRDKFSEVDTELLEQKTRIDQQIVSVPQPSEIVDARVDKNAKVYTILKDRIDAEQSKVEDAYRDKNGKVFTSLKSRIDSEQGKIEEAYKDKSNVVFPSLKDRINAEQSKIEEAYVDKNNKSYTSLKSRIDAEQTKIENAFVKADGTTFTSLSERLNSIDTDIVEVNNDIVDINSTLATNSTNITNLQNTIRFDPVGDTGQSLAMRDSLFIKNDKNIFGYLSDGTYANLATVEQNNIVKFGDWNAVAWIAAKDYISFKVPSMSLVEQVDATTGNNISTPRIIYHQGNQGHHALYHTNGGTQKLNQNVKNKLTILDNIISQFPVNSATIGSGTYKIPRTGVYYFQFIVRPTAITNVTSALRMGITRTRDSVVTEIDMYDVIMSNVYQTGFYGGNFVYTLNEGDVVYPWLNPLSEDITIQAGTKYYIYFMGDRPTT